MTYTPDLPFNAFTHSATARPSFTGRNSRLITRLPLCLRSDLRASAGLRWQWISPEDANPRLKTRLLRVCKARRNYFRWRMTKISLNWTPLRAFRIFWRVSGETFRLPLISWETCPPWSPAKRPKLFWDIFSRARIVSKAFCLIWTLSFIVNFNAHYVCSFIPLNR